MLQLQPDEESEENEEKLTANVFFLGAVTAIVCVAFSLERLVMTIVAALLIGGFYAEIVFRGIDLIRKEYSDWEHEILITFVN